MAFGLFSVFTALVLIVCGVALFPVLLIVGAFVLVFSLVAGVLGLVLRVVGGILLLVLAVPLMLGGIAVAFAFAVAILHAAVPLLLVIGLIWLIVRHNRGTSPIAGSR